MKKIFYAAFFAVFAMAGLASQSHADSLVYTGTFSSTAVKGYDTVSYFQGDGMPVKGSEEFQTQWHGAKWLFSSQANLDAFEANPEKYAPQYGGHCAWATSRGSFVKGDPKVFHIHKGKLYLNYDKSIAEKWLPEKADLIPLADEEYSKLLDNQ